MTLLKLKSVMNLLVMGPCPESFDNLLGLT